MNEKAKPVARLQAGSGQTHYVPARKLRSSARLLIEAVAHFIPAQPDDDCVTLHRYDRQTGEETKISLKHSELQEFVDYVTEFIELRNAEPGKHLLISLGDGGLGAVGSQPEQAARALVAAIQDERVREFIQETPLDQAMVQAITARSRLREVSLAIKELEEALAADQQLEKTYDSWLRRHGWAFGVSYLPADGVRAITTSDQVDFLLPVTMTGHRDVAELKRPDHEVLRWDKDHKNWYFSREASMGIGQCHRYLEKLQDRHPNRIEDEPNILISYPRALLVIGRSADWEHERRHALDGLNSRLHGIRVMTYDHLLAQAHRFKELLEGDEPPRVARAVPPPPPTGVPPPAPSEFPPPPKTPSDFPPPPYDVTTPPPSDDDVPF